MKKAVIFLIFFSFVSISSGQELKGTLDLNEVAKYMVGLSKRIVVVAEKLIALDEELIFSLSKKLPVEKSIVASKSTSANRQVELLVQRLTELFNLLPPGFSGKSEVGVNQREYQKLMEQHSRNVAIICKLSPEIGELLSVKRIRGKGDAIPMGGASGKSMPGPQATQKASDLADTQSSPSGGSSSQSGKSMPSGSPSGPSAISAEKAQSKSVSQAPKDAVLTPQGIKRDSQTSIISDFSPENQKIKADFTSSVDSQF